MKERYGNEVPWWLRKLGVWRISESCIEARWGWFSPKPALELRYGYTYNEARPCVDFGLLWGKWSINVPFAKAPGFDFDKFEHSYGFYWFGSSLVWVWGKGSKHWNIPFRSWNFLTHEVRDAGGTWHPASTDFPPNDARYTESHPYTYKLRSGEVQERTATIFVERRTWARKWLPLSKMTVTQISVDFDGEVGERSGSWKGGCVGSSYEMLPGESMLQTLRRMERERKFN